MVLEVVKVKARELYPRDVIRERWVHRTSGVPGEAVSGARAGTCRGSPHRVRKERLSELGGVGSGCWTVSAGPEDPSASQQGGGTWCSLVASRENTGAAEGARTGLTAG